MANVVSSLPSPSLITDTDTTTITLDVQGMKCAGCVAAVERQLTQQSGVLSACVNLITQVAVVEYEEKAINPEKLAQKLTDNGFPSQLRSTSAMTLGESTRKASEQRRREREQNLRELWIAAILLLFSGLGHLGHLGGPSIPYINDIRFHWGLATLALLFPGRSLIIEGARALGSGMPNMNTLVGLGTVSAYLASCTALLWTQLGWDCFFDEPVMLLGFIFLGRTLESRARGKATAALESLVALQPAKARLVGQNQNDLEFLEIPVEQVKVGEWVKVLPGEKMPVDGQIVNGTTTVDESLLTGESYPVVKKDGDEVIAGSMNLSGMVLVQTSKIGQNSTLAQIIASVEDAQTRKAPIQKLADQIAGYFAYGVIAIASMTFLFWQLIGTNVFSDRLAAYSSSPLLLSLKLAIAVLVVACPCALGLATPTAILVGTGIGAEQGLLIKGGDVLEKAHKVRTLVFDKTGTLTCGHPKVTDSLPLTAISPETLLQLAGSLENNTTHPLGTAIIEAAQQKEITLLTVINCQTEAGLGIKGEIEGATYFLGNEMWLEENEIQNLPQLTEKTDALSQEGKTLIYLADQTDILGIIALKDELRPDALETVEKLQAMGLELALLSGDQPNVASAIAQQVKISQVFAPIRPNEKAKIIQQLQSEQSSHLVAMIGDGINDAPALAQADIGISLQESTEIAIETADLVLMGNQLSRLPFALQLSWATFKKIRQNLFWALGYNLIGIPVAAGVLLPYKGIMLSPPIAAAFMAMSSVIVVSNALLLRYTFVEPK
ncbi:MAG: heavy metal translocating P-type ATPase [Microcystaceae cyanobacterium]